MFSALQNVTPSHLCDPNLFDFKTLRRGEMPVGIDGDIAFDKEEIKPLVWQEDDEATDYNQNELIRFKQVN